MERRISHQRIQLCRERYRSRTLSDREPAEEYRIAILGGTLTAGFANYLRWPDLVQDALNRWATWRAFIGRKFTRVLSFRLLGGGFIHLAAVDKYATQRFSPW